MASHGARVAIPLFVLSIVGARIAGSAALDALPAPTLKAEAKPLSRSALEVGGKHGLLLLLARDDGTAQWAAVDGKALAGASRHPSGFLLRDVATSGSLASVGASPREVGGAIVQEGDLPDLALRFHARYEPFGEGIRVAGWIEDSRKHDRAISVYYALPFSRDSLTWYDDARTSRPVGSDGEAARLRDLAAGANGKYTAFPLSAVANRKAGLSFGIPMNQPAIFRLGYSADTEQLYLAFDFGLTAATAKFPGRADFSFVILAIDPAWGFRSALERYYATYSDLFAKRVKKEGIWVFSDIAHLENPDDFGFMFHEISGAADKMRQILPLDDRLGIGSFRYTTPIPYNMNMPKNEPKTYELAMKTLEDRQKAGDARALAQSICGLRNDDQTFWHRMVDYPWVNGAHFAQNTDPEIPESGAAHNRAHLNYDPSDAGGWHRKSAPFEPGLGLDGEYLDSLGMFSGLLNFARDQFATADYPLTFSLKTRTPCLIQDWSCTEFCRWESEDLHQKGKLLMSNGHPDRFCFMAPYIDALGREVHWHKGKSGEYTPEADSTMNYRRAVCGQKPFLMLLNDDFSKVTPEAIEKYFKRSLFYGFYPSMFVYQAKVNGKWVSKHYFASPELYNRDRPLFKKYVPLIRRINSAGWQPVTLAQCEDADVWIERFGPGADGRVYLTVLNPSDTAKLARIGIDGKSLGLGKKAAQVAELTTGRAVERESDSQFRFELPAEDVALLELNSGD
ncbi:MAG: hypothetical protein NTW86_15605 [Candidatus Sumerlaeota bacterium]|nr:hypothetical protein [Candidatus Sumerlaeota bacterium]